VLGTIRDATDKVFDYVRDLGREVQMKVTPMATGTRESMATVKRYANTIRDIDYKMSAAIDKLERNHSPEALKAMWDRADEESVMRQRGEKSENMGIATLEPNERADVEAFQPIAKAAWNRARELGLVEGEGLPFYTPRMLLNIASGEGPRSLDRIGGNFST
jgi:hypothetical protein